MIWNKPFDLSFVQPTIRELIDWPSDLVNVHGTPLSPEKAGATRARFALILLSQLIDSTIPDRDQIDEVIL